MDEQIEEQWRSVVGFESWYQVSNLGRVRKSRRTKGGRGLGYILKTHDAAKGESKYQQLTLRRPDGTYTRSLLHVLVAEAWLGPSNGLEVNHRDLNPENNRLDNLEYVTRQGNQLHAVANQARKKKARRVHKGCIRMMRALRVDGMSLPDVAALFDVSVRTARKHTRGALPLDENGERVHKQGRPQKPSPEEVPQEEEGWTYFTSPDAHEETPGMPTKSWSKKSGIEAML